MVPGLAVGGLVGCKCHESTKTSQRNKRLNSLRFSSDHASGIWQTKTVGGSVGRKCDKPIKINQDQLKPIKITN